MAQNSTHVKARTYNKVGLGFLILIGALLVFGFAGRSEINRDAFGACIILSISQLVVFSATAANKKMRALALGLLAGSILSIIGMAATVHSSTFLAIYGFFAVAFIGALAHAFYNIKQPDKWAGVHRWFLPSKV